MTAYTQIPLALIIWVGALFLFVSVSIALKLGWAEGPRDDVYYVIGGAFGVISVMGLALATDNLGQQLAGVFKAITG